MVSSVIPFHSVPLGHPLPLDEHACSVSLPTWSSVVGYEEGSPQITSKMACGYPRFVYHPYIIQLMDAALDIDIKLQKNKCVQKGDYDCLVLPNRNSALRCHDFLVKACGYLDGKAISPRICQESAYQVVGDWRIHLFSHDNAVDPHNSLDLNVYDENSPIRVLDLGAQDVHAVIFPAKTMFAIEAKSYWQHTGEVVSSRRAECALDQLGLAEGSASDDEMSISSSSSGLKRVTNQFYDKPSDGWKKCRFSNDMHLVLFPSESNDSSSENSYAGIQQRIASIIQIPNDCIFLAPSGMASIYHAIRAARRYSLNKNPSQDGGTSIVFGFPYLDTLKMCSRKELVPEGVHFFGYGNKNDLDSMEKMLRERAKNNNGNAGISVLITEFPSNPLLNCPDLIKLRTLADEFDFALIVDDTIGNFANLDLIHSGLADAVCTSLTKLFNGRGDAMAGSIATNPNTKIGKWMQNDLEKNHILNEGLYESDARAIYINSSDFLERSDQINQTTEALADWLNQRDEVEEMYYPKYTCPEEYSKVMNTNDFGGRHTAGYGGLFSLVLHPHVCRRTFFDQIDISKGPSLGTNFTLSCPYTLLAHYHELDFALTYNVQPGLIRFAIGLENLDSLKEKFDSAFRESKLHPKLPKANITQTRSYTTGSFASTKAIGRGNFGLSTAYQRLSSPSSIRYRMISTVRNDEHSYIGGQFRFDSYPLCSSHRLMRIASRTILLRRF